MGLESLLDGWSPAPSEPASCLYVAAGVEASAMEVCRFRGPGLAGAAARVGTPGVGVGHRVGLSQRWGDAGLVVVPPFPLAETRLDRGVGPVAATFGVLAAEHTVGVVLVRLGRFSVAVYQGEGLVSSKTDSRYVKGRHHAGGTSQLRYPAHHGKGRPGSCTRRPGDAVQSQFGEYEPLDYILLGGERFTLDGLLKECPYLQRQQDKILGRRLNVRDPKRDTLEAVGRMLTSSRVYPLDGFRLLLVFDTHGPSYAEHYNQTEP